ncbi:cytochrome c6 PetJ [Merismopedia glauca]|uniref:Cytochrome c6 n=1 Tax=Merismopedia glauca CCAP 1448/3 TaxID=1296344 RepID=A0A2T1C513_9CYAN|nr:c-type cytochrome [Merismopedia glauca]PSB03349.1 cytochrome C6 [Merismopedia glauca CCAP 1448/3]
MKKLLWTAVILMTTMIFGLAQPVLAADLDNGGKLFANNCAACHAGGKNVVNPQKTLQKADLEKWEMYDAGKITTQVTNGKGAMPSFKGRLSDADIADVAAYVLAQADKGW